MTLLRFISLAGSAFSPQELSQNILAILKSTRADMEISNELLDMLGYESFDFVELLMKNRVRILTAHSENKGRQRKGPGFGPQITIQTEEDKFLEKLKKKEKKKKANRDEEPVEPVDPAVLRALREEALSQGPKTTILPNQGPRSTGPVFGTSMLPEGTTRKQFKVKC